MTPNRAERSTPASRPAIGQRFNPSHHVCGFYPPDEVGHNTNLKLTDGQKRLYERGVRWAGKNGVFWYAFPTIAEALGKSVRQVKDDMATLEAKGLIGHTRRRRQSNLYHFLWHAIFEVQSIAHQEGVLEARDGVILEDSKVQSTAHQEGILEVQDGATPEGPKVRSTAQKSCHESECCHHHQKEKLESPLASLAVRKTSLNRTEAETAANASGRVNPLSESGKADVDEKPAQTPAAPVTPKNAFLLRVAQRHPEIDASACFADVQGELRRAAIPIEAYLRRDLLSTTNPKALTNPRGYYRNLAKTMVAEHQKQMAGIPTETVVETPRCAKCNGSGYLLEQTEGQRPRLTGEFCACKLGKDLAAIERRAAKKAAAAAAGKQPGQSPGQPLPTAGICNDETPTNPAESLGAARPAQTACA
jgi:hypothetical protein